MRNDEQNRRQKEKGYERQFDSEKRQLHRAFEQQIRMRNGARRYADIEKSKKITEPNSRADSGRVLDALADCVEIMRLRGEFFRER